jgi:hypothetical protein
MRAGKFNESSGGSEGRQVMVMMLLLRLECFETDLLITYNLPAPVAHDEADSCAGGEVAEAVQSGTRVRSHLDILRAYYARYDPGKTEAAIGVILAKRDDGSPFWFPRLAAALQKKYGRAPALAAAGQREEAEEALGIFARCCNLHERSLFS